MKQQDKDLIVDNILSFYKRNPKSFSRMIDNVSSSLDNINKLKEEITNLKDGVAILELKIKYLKEVLKNGAQD